VIPSRESTNIDLTLGGDERSRLFDREWIVKPGPDILAESSVQESLRNEAVEASRTIDRPSVTFITDSNVLLQFFERDEKLIRLLNTTFDEILQSKRLYVPSNDLESSTSAQFVAIDPRTSREVEIEVTQLFSLATFIDLEPGMTNEFSDGLEEAIERYGEKALRAIEDVILSKKTNTAIAMEALQCIGHTESRKWHDERRKMLERCLLESPSAWVRDGAGLGIASLDNPESIIALKRAIRKEDSIALKDDLTMVLNQLQDTLLES